MEVFLRLKSERKRLGLNQTDLAKIGGVKQLAQSNYETGKRSPDASYLSAVAKSGVDIQFVVTGVRSVTADEEVQKVVSAYLAASSKQQRDALLVLLGADVGKADQRFKNAKIGQQIKVEGNEGGMTFGDVHMSSDKKKK